MKHTITPLLILLLAACSNEFSANNMADKALNLSGCPEAETYLQDIAQWSLEKTGALAATDEVVSEFTNKLKKHELSPEIKLKLIEAFKTLYQEIENPVKSMSSTKDALNDLGRLEAKSHSNFKLQEKYDEALQNYKDLAFKHLKSCEPPKLIDEPDDSQSSNSGASDQDTIDNQPNTPFFEELKSKTANLSQYGALKSFSVAYQSCDAIAIDPLTQETQDTIGIKVVGRHSSGAGNIREIENITDVRRTHQYIKNYRKPASNCVDSTIKPLIYDFGGKPHSTTASDSNLDFFKDAGSGSKELGVDCSGYVFSALMSAGLKLAPDKPLRARNVNFIPARHYKNFEQSGMTCFQRVKAGSNENLKPGDIFASNGHIFIVNKVGEDPLGSIRASKNNSCSSITYEDFNFTLLQSSPSKGATGMNHMEAPDYLSESDTMRVGLEKFARLDCENKRKNQLTMPKFDEASLIRHKQTSECIADKSIELQGQSCLERCSFDG